MGKEIMRNEFNLATFINKVYPIHPIITYNVEITKIFSSELINIDTPFLKWDTGVYEYISVDVSGNIVQPVCYVNQYDHNNQLMVMEYYILIDFTIGVFVKRRLS